MSADTALDNNDPLITIGITCFNAAETIRRAVDSALAQAWPNFEIIVVDDGSSDESVSILKAIDDPRVRLVQHELNKGYPSALNTIIDHARGAYIAFFDDDDDHDPDRLMHQYKRLCAFEGEHEDGPILCYTHRRVFIRGCEKPDAFVTAIGACGGDGQQREPHGPMVADYLLLHKKPDGYSWGEFGSGTLMAHTDTLKKFKFDPDFKRCAEWDLAVRCALSGGYFIAADQALVIQHKTKTVDKAGKTPLFYGLLLRRKHKKYLKKKGLYWASLCLAHARFYYFRGRVWRSRFWYGLARLCGA